MLLIEGGDLACGELLMLVNRRIQGIAAGTVIGIHSEDPAAALDIPAWCHLTGHRYLGRAAADAPFRVTLVRTPSPVDPGRPWHRRSVTETTV